jgi:tetratricopeptide (TPR) repeat protein
LNQTIDNDLSSSDHSENPQILCLLAGILNELNDEKCISLYEKVTKINPKFYLAYKGLGNFYLKNKNYQLSKENYDKAIEINPKRFGPIYKNLGVALLNLGQEPSARIAFETYLKNVPNAGDKGNVLQFLNS